ncbi:MAG: polysaccharide deacetylase family protein, partial [Clostridium sp.]|nr:polysaccharide deacetylase family protein [Clostridium sp.]
MKSYKKIFISLIVVFFTITTSCIYNYLSTSAPVLYLLNKKLPIYSVDSEEKSVAITFDINWAENDYLEEILAVLDKHEVKATFFIMGKWVTYNDTNTKNFIN